jgi:hypothetical protein
MANITAVADAYFAGVIAHDPDAVQACFARDAVLINGETVLHGADEIGAFYRANLQIEDLRPTPGPYVVDGDRLAVEIVLHVVGQDFELADFFTIVDGKINDRRRQDHPARDLRAAGPGRPHPFIAFGRPASFSPGRRAGGLPCGRAPPLRSSPSASG